MEGHQGLERQMCGCWRGTGAEVQRWGLELRRCCGGQVPPTPRFGQGCEQQGSPCPPLWPAGPLSSSSSCTASPTPQVRVPKRGGGPGE